MEMMFVVSVEEKHSAFAPEPKRYFGPFSTQDEARAFIRKVRETPGFRGDIYLNDVESPDNY